MGFLEIFVITVASVDVILGIIYAIDLIKKR